MKEYLEFALKIGEYAKKEMLDNFDNNNELSYKSDRTVVTEIDKKINHYLIEEVNKEYPNHCVIGEEEKYIIDSKYVWVCDPIDGTGMYTNKIPVSVFSLALVLDGEPIVGVVIDPYLNKTYTAIKGEGAYCNNNKIHVNNNEFGDLGYRVNFEMWNNSKFNNLRIIENMLPYVKISSIGSVARSCMAIASGDFSCDLFPGCEHANCDMAASYLIVTEAGGKVTDYNGNLQRYDKDLNGAIITNKVSHEKVLEYVKEYK